MTKESSSFTFFKWSNCKSKDPLNPDTIEIKVIDPEPFSSDIYTNIRGLVKDGDNLNEKIVAVKSLTSRNTSLYDKWMKGKENGKIKAGRWVRIKTWLSTSTRNKELPIRRYIVEYIEDR